MKESEKQGIEKNSIKDLYYQKDLKTIESELDSDLNLGLSSEKLKGRKEKYGVNEFTPPKEKSLFMKVIDCLSDFMILILIVAALISIGINFYNLSKGLETDFAESVTIILAIILQAFISIYMENTSSKAFALLNKLGTNIKVKVLRDGKPLLIDKVDVTVGDIVILETGDKVPADGRLIECQDLRIDESMLTGESNTIKKRHDIVFNEEIPLAERINMVYGGTNVSEGRGLMIVTSIGDNSEMGNIAKSLKNEENDSTPLQEKLDVLGKRISFIGFIVAGAIFLFDIVKMYMSNTLSFTNAQDSFVTSVALIVAAVPEGLPTMVAITLALNMKKMATLNALVKKMVACETIGSVNIICSDKTGTLTENKMTVRDIWTNGDFIKSDSLKDENELVLNFVLNGTSNLEKENGKTIFIGNPTECSLLQCIDNNENFPSYDNLREEYTIYHQYAFSSDRKMMSTITKQNGQTKILSKGAPEKILGLCNKVLYNGEIIDLTNDIKSIIENEIISLQEQARRVLGFAYQDIKEENVENYETMQDELEKDLIFIGFVGISDPLRSDIYDSISKCHSAGIDVKILTGDNIVTAKAIANELHLLDDNSLIYEAKDIEVMSDDELKKQLPNISVIARSKPDTKRRVVSLLKELGNSVAVTGDGVNDAPALKKADVGIAMGISGTEVSKEAADIVLLNDAFSTIVNSVKFGRGIYENFQRFIVFQLTVNVVAFLIAILARVFNFEMPFTTVQLLWVNIIMDGPPALTLGLEKVRDHVMDRKPIPRDSNIITKDMFFRIVSNAAYMITMLLIIQLVNPFGFKQEELTTIMFTTFVMFQLFNAFNAREFNTDSILPRLFDNKYLLYAFSICILIQFLAVEIGHSVFRTVSLSLNTWIIIILYSFSIIIFSELVKLVRKIIKK